MSHRTRRRRSRSRVLRCVVPVVAVVLLAVACTPAQFQQWWVSQGNRPLAEPQLSQMAALATDYWNEEFRKARFSASVHEIDGALAARMTPSSWRPGCPVPLRDLRLLRLSHMGFDGSERAGEIVVHADVVFDVVVAFRAMWDAGFPIRSLRLVDDFGGDDAASMAADNTSAFNCRPVAGGSGWSQHSYGRAVDINPQENPYVRGGSVEPAGGAAYLDRARVRPGMLVEGRVPVTTFDRLGWGWGGRWSSLKDYQHLSRNGR